MIEPNWILQLQQQQYTSQEHINSKITQQSTKTWLQKLRLTNHAHQTKASWAILKITKQYKKRENMGERMGNRKNNETTRNKNTTKRNQITN